jgi:hypothetical protein
MKFSMQILCFLFNYISFSQTDTINTVNNKLKIKNLNKGESTYMVYFLDRINSPKYNLEIWDRYVHQNPNGTYSVKWLRQSPHQISDYNI